MKQSGKSLDEITAAPQRDYDVDITPSGLRHAINRGAIRLQRALQILVVYGVTEVSIKR